MAVRKVGQAEAESPALHWGLWEQATSLALARFPEVGAAMAGLQQRILGPTTGVFWLFTLVVCGEYAPRLLLRSLRFLQIPSSPENAQ